ncbi:MAG: M23 family metallopeptidase, partial [Cellulosimicrobium cellulans]
MIPLGQSGATGPVGGIGHVGHAGLAPAILIDSRALVPFGRTLVGTVAKGGNAPLNVASVGLKRPPEGSLMAPLESLASSSPFGFRVSPINGRSGDFHLGQDFAAGCGTRVYSADAGVVRAAGWHPWGGGNRVEIDHGNGLITTYNHLEAIAVRTGESVQVGQVIARVGTTGWSTGCHLHFETILNGEHTSPLNWRLLPILQVDKLADIAMVSYEGKTANAATALPWAIPVAADNSHTVLHGEDELPEAPEVAEVDTPPAPTETAPTGGPSPDGTATTKPPTTTAPPTPTETTPTDEPSSDETSSDEPSSDETTITTPPRTTAPPSTSTPSTTT